MLCRCKPSTETFYQCKTRTDTRLVSPDNSMIEMMIAVDDDDHSRMRQGLKKLRDALFPNPCIYDFMHLKYYTDLVFQNLPVMLGAGAFSADVYVFIMFEKLLPNKSMHVDRVTRSFSLQSHDVKYRCEQVLDSTCQLPQ